MKQVIKTTLLISLTVLLLLFVLFVDTTFYHIPSFIKIYRIERELIICFAALLIYLRLRSYLQQRKLTLKKTLLAVYVLIIGLFVGTLLPQLSLKKFLVLWDDNPFLAEFPFIWNTVSEFCTVVTITIFFVILIFVKKLLNYRPNRYSNFEYRLLLLILMLGTLIFNFIEDRYTYDRFTLLQQSDSALIWIIGAALVIVTLVISLYKSWIDVLNKKEKYTGFLLSLIIIPVGLYLLFSNLLFPVFVFSTTVKGFVLAMLIFINVYVIASFIGFLFRLPTASIYDRVTTEIQSVAQISKMISESTDIQTLFHTIVSHACQLTSSDACWLSFEGGSQPLTGIMASVHLSDKEASQLGQANADCIGNIVRSSQEAVLIHNIEEDDRTVPLHSLDLKWRSLIAVPLTKADQVVGVLYSAKKSTYAYDENDLHTLKSFAIQINIVLSSASFTGKFERLPGKGAAEARVCQLKMNRLTLYCPELPNSYADRITLPDSRGLFFQITYSADLADNRIEVRGILKTLYTLEMNPDAAFTKADRMISEEYPKAKLTVLMIDTATNLISLYSHRRYRIKRIYSENDRIVVEPIDYDMADGGESHYYLTGFSFKNGYLLIGPGSLIDPIDQQWLDDLCENYSAIGVEDILKKINPESRQDSGMIFYCLLKE